MNQPYGPPGENTPQNPQQWGQQYPGSAPGGFPAQGQPPQPGYGAQPTPPPGFHPQQPQPGFGQPYQSAPDQGQAPYGHQQPGFAPYSPQQGYGQQPHHAGKAKKSPLLFILGGLALIVAVVAVLGFVWPAWFITKVLDQTGVQDGVKKVITEQYKIQKAEEIKCPADQEVREGNTFECTAKINGADKKISITVKNTNGDFEVGLPQ